jgi:hypothetical protein
MLINDQVAYDILSQKNCDWRDELIWECIPRAVGKLEVRVGAELEIISSSNSSESCKDIYEDKTGFAAAQVTNSNGRWHVISRFHLQGARLVLIQPAPIQMTPSSTQHPLRSTRRHAHSTVTLIPLLSILGKEIIKSCARVTSLSSVSNSSSSGPSGRKRTASAQYSSAFARLRCLLVSDFPNSDMKCRTYFWPRQFLEPRAKGT